MLSFPGDPEKAVGSSKRILVSTAAVLAVFCCQRAKGDLSITTASGSESAQVTDEYGNTNSAGNSGVNEDSVASLTSEPPQEQGNPFAENDDMYVDSSEMYTTSSSSIYEEGGIEPSSNTGGTDAGTAKNSASFTDSVPQLLTITGSLNGTTFAFEDATATLNETAELTEAGQVNPLFQQNESNTGAQANTTWYDSVSYATVLQPGQTYTLSVTSSLNVQFGGTDDDSTGYGITASVGPVPEPSSLGLILGAVGLAGLRRRSRSLAQLLLNCRN